MEFKGPYSLDTFVQIIGWKMKLNLNIMFEASFKTAILYRNQLVDIECKLNLIMLIIE